MARRALVIGNWKMNGLRASETELAALVAGLAERTALDVDVGLCPPATLIARFAESTAAAPVTIGAQTCHAAASGAHTGDVSAEMIADVGGRLVLVGHSERRADHHETDAMVRAKAQAAHRAGLTAVICVGETEAERDAGQALDVIARQIEASTPDSATAENTVIAYEPVWAIGTGRTPTTPDIAEAHAGARARVAAKLGAETAAAMRLLYGGSVKPANAAEIFALEDVDGGLIGGASLKAADLLQIIDAAA